MNFKIYMRRLLTIALVAIFTVQVAHGLELNLDDDSDLLGSASPGTPIQAQDSSCVLSGIWRSLSEKDAKEEDVWQAPQEIIKVPKWPFSKDVTQLILSYVADENCREVASVTFSGMPQSFFPKFYMVISGKTVNLFSQSPELLTQKMIQQCSKNALLKFIRCANISPDITSLQLVQPSVVAFGFNNGTIQLAKLNNLSPLKNFTLKNCTQSITALLPVGDQEIVYVSKDFPSQVHSIALNGPADAAGKIVYDASSAIVALKKASLPQSILVFTVDSVRQLRVKTRKGLWEEVTQRNLADNLLLSPYCSKFITVTPAGNSMIPYQDKETLRWKLIASDDFTEIGDVSFSEQELELPICMSLCDPKKDALLKLSNNAPAALTLSLLTLAPYTIVPEA